MKAFAIKPFEECAGGGISLSTRLSPWITTGLNITRSNHTITGSSTCFVNPFNFIPHTGLFSTDRFGCNQVGRTALRVGKC